MININYMAESFPRSTYGRRLQGHNTLQVDWHDLVWAAITVGKRNTSQITKSGIYSVYEIINRTTLIWTSLKVDSGELTKTDVYEEMDPTEKVFVSFSLGMTISKLFSSKLLNTPWLEHVANIDNRIKVNKQTRSRPDLIGLNHRREFLVVEAKGRTNGFDRKTQEKAKAQTQVISRIGGQPPILRVASQSFFKESLQVFFEDPEDVSKDPIEIETNIDSFYRSYYGLFQNLSGTELELLKPLGIHLSFDERLKKAFEQDNFDSLEIEQVESDFNESGYKIFPDGIKIKLDPEIWNDDLLHLNPDER